MISLSTLLSLMNPGWTSLIAGRVAAWPALSAACEPEDQLCRAVRRATGNAWLGQAADWVIAKPLVILTILVLGFLTRWLLHKLIGRVVNRAVTGSLGSSMMRARTRSPDEEERFALAQERRRLRAETLGSVLRSIASITVFTVVTMMVLAELGLNIAPLLASAGLVGVALGFGAQSLVRDFLSGLFIFFEDQYGVGDTVRVNEVEGVVEAITLRITRLRDGEGTIWYLRNGEILKVGNVSQRGTLRGEV